MFVGWALIRRAGSPDWSVRARLRTDLILRLRWCGLKIMDPERRTRFDRNWNLFCSEEGELQKGWKEEETSEVKTTTPRTRSPISGHGSNLSTLSSSPIATSEIFLSQFYLLFSQSYINLSISGEEELFFATTLC